MAFFMKKNSKNMLEYQEKAVPLQMKCLFSYMKTSIKQAKTPKILHLGK